MCVHACVREYDTFSLDVRSKRAEPISSEHGEERFLVRGNKISVIEHILKLNSAQMYSLPLHGLLKAKTVANTRFPSIAFGSFKIIFSKGDEVSKCCAPQTQACSLL